MTQFITRFIPAIALVAASLTAPAFAGSSSQMSTKSTPAGMAVDERDRGIWPSGRSIGTVGTSVSVPAALALTPDERGQFTDDTITRSQFPALDRNADYAGPRR